MATRLGEESAWAYYLLGDAYSKKRAYTKALAAFRHALDLEPDNFDYKKRIEGLERLGR